MCDSFNFRLNRSESYGQYIYIMQKKLVRLSFITKSITAIATILASVLIAPMAWSHVDPEHPLEHRIWHLEQLVEKLSIQLNEESEHRVYSKHEPIEVKLSGGLKLKTADKKREFQVGGQIAVNHEWIRGAYNADVQNGTLATANLGDTAQKTEMRSFWFRFSGTVDYNWKYQMMFDMNSGRPFMGYIRYQGFDAGRITIGKQRESFGLSRFSSGLAAEASAVSLRMAPLLSMGIAFNGYHDRFTYAFGIFHEDESDPLADTDNSEEYAFSTRGTWDPIREPGDIFHLGLSLSKRDFGGGPFQMKSRMGAHTIGSFYPVQSASFNAESGDYIGLEFALVKGPWTVSSELVNARIDEFNSPTTYDFTGYFIQAGHFFGDYTENFNRKNGRFKRFKPPAGESVWQLIVRYGDIDLNDAGKGVHDKEFTVGLSWYANRSVRLMGNYTRLKVSGDAAAAIVGDDTKGETASVRVQYFF